nr:hypothetical protein JVH1_9176 [Rhodococcus sp. JVH1]
MRQILVTIPTELTSMSGRSRAHACSTRSTPSSIESESAVEISAVM